METELPPSESIEKKAEALESLIAGPLSSASSRLLCRSRGLPSDKDFHFYNNFDEFKLPAKEITTKTKSSLGEIASSVSLWGSKKPPPLPDELDEAYDWLVNLNDDFLEKFGISMDEFRSSREKHELQKEVVESGDGFQLVCGKKKKRDIELNQERYGGLSPSSGIKIVSIDKKTIAARAKVPFHLPNIPRPQIEFNILVNNKNQPFDHVWLEKSEDRSYFIHPMEKLSVPDFIDRNIKADEIVKPLSLERTQFKFVEGVNDLKEMARKLREVNEFAVDLEHNNYRSFLGLTCLMQISTRTEDFIVDTLKVRVHIGPYLRELFKDPLKKKIMHGADCDILWLQRDFGIYVCNLFDTGQASRVLDLERNSLEYLLHHFCGVQANKEYQKADWRIRPLPDEMIKYAREDTHYLLHIYDLMRCKLLSSSSDGNDLLLEVYKRSSKVCMQLYEKELMTDTSYLYTYGLAEADFDSKQLAIVSGLCAWRDTIAREEDESTGYVLPNKAVLEIARQMPQTTGHLRQMVKSKHPYVYRHLNAVIKIINHAIANSSAFDCVVEELKKKRMEALAIQASQADNPDSVTETNHSIDQIASTCQEEKKMQQLSLLEMTSPTVGEVEKNTNNEASSSSQLHVEAIPTASIQVLKKPAKGFGALFGNSSRKTVPLNGSASEKEKNEIKVEQIKASVALPFFPFFGRGVVSEPAAKSASPPPIVMQTPEQPPITTRLTEDIIPLEDHSDGRSPLPECSTSWEENAVKSNADTRQSGMSLSDLSAGFQQCSNYISKGWEANREPSPYVAPFDYSAARKNLRFGEVRKGSGGEADAGTNSGHLPASSRDARKGLRGGRNAGEEGQRGQQPRRRQAFPNSGNRSTTYRC